MRCHKTKTQHIKVFCGLGRKINMINKYRFAILGGTLGLLLAACGHQSKVNQTTQTLVTPTSNQLNAQIVGGEVAAPHSLPYQALVMNFSPDKEGFFLCGGTIIDKKWILTAAHCVDDTTAERVKVRVGVHNRTTDPAEGQLIGVKALHNHPDFVRVDGGFDIALLELDADITDANAQPARLPTADLDQVLTTERSPVVISGWGRVTAGSDGETSPVLRKNVIPVSTTPCFRAPGNTLCGLPQKTPQDSCKGDSGGPLSSNDQGYTYVLGVVSYGPKLCSGNGVYTRVSQYLDWIHEVSGVPANTSTTTPLQSLAPTAAFEVKTSRHGPIAEFKSLATDPENRLFSHVWDFGDGQTSTETNPRYIYHEAGTYTVKLTVRDHAGYTHSTQQEVTVTAQNTAPIDDTPLPSVHTGQVVAKKPAYVPNPHGFWFDGGTLNAQMSGTGAADLDLLLERKSDIAGVWVIVDRSTALHSSNENIEKQVPKGTYRWRVHTQRDTGEYSLSYTLTDK